MYGTPGYLSPEQAMAEATGRRTQRPVRPWGHAVRGDHRRACLRRRQSCPAAACAALEHEAPQLSARRPDAPAGLSSLLAALTARDVSGRPRSARLVARLLAPFIGDETDAEAMLLARLSTGSERERAEARTVQGTPTRRLGSPRTLPLSRLHGCALRTAAHVRWVRRRPAKKGRAKPVPARQ